MTDHHRRNEHNDEREEYCASVTVKVKRGGTKKKSKQSTLKTADKAAGPRRPRIETKSVPNRYTMTRLVSPK